MSLLLSLFHGFGLVVFVLGIQGALYLPLTVAYEVWKRRALRRLPPFRGTVSVVVPAFDEARTIRRSVLSILASSWPALDVVVVDDGSRDGTAEAIQDLAQAGHVRLLRQPNGGKASALNAGIAVARGEVVLYTDADSLFLPDTVAKTVRWFADPRIDAVCGNDAPLHTRTSLQRLLAVTTHIGTGYVRRALSLLGALPIISGNLGAIRRSVLEEIGGFARVWGEDLEITLRLHRHGKRIVFDPEPMVLADCPRTFGALWKQRVRWTRSYLKVVRRYPDLFLRRARWPFSLYLPINFANTAIVPLVQAALVVALPLAVSAGWLRFEGPVEVATWLGLWFFLAVAVYAILLDRRPADLRYLSAGPLVLPLSWFFDAVVIHSWFMELRGAEERWHKIERGPAASGVRTGRRAFALAAAGVLLAAGGAGWGLKAALAPRPAPLPAGVDASAPRRFQLSVAMHFDAWPDWRDAVRRLQERPLADRTDVVGVGAGRPEWTYFRWQGHEDRWSNHQRGEPRSDLLRAAAEAFHASGQRVAAFVDLFAPRWVKEHPQDGAVRHDGVRVPEQVSLTALADGEYGKLVVEMVGYLAAEYPIDVVNLTEAAYRETSFSAADLASYRARTGRKDWPRDARGQVDVEDPSVWEWKSELMERFVARAAEAVHRHGKALYVDVSASWKDLTRDGKDHGHDYGRLLRHADRIVVWDYHRLEGLPDTASRDLVRHLASRYPPERFTVSLGLWGHQAPVGAAELDASVAAALEGGARNLWVTPDELVTPEHWAAVLRRWMPARGAAAAAEPAGAQATR